MKNTITILLILMCLGFGSSTTKTEDRNTYRGVNPYIGEVIMFAGNFAPQGWAKCEGQLLSIAQNSALFSILGTQYGGDGETTFGLPDLRGRVPLGSGQGPGLPNFSVGQKGGSDTNTITVAQMPAHNHAVNAVTEDGDQSVPAGHYPAGTKLLDGEYASTGTFAQMNAGMIGNTGGGQSINNRQPYQTVTFIIALQGTFPSPSRIED